MSGAVLVGFVVTIALGIGANGAMNLDGCGNRVKLISARVSLERVRLAHERGGDAHAILTPVIEMCAGVESIPGNEAWHAIRDEAEQLRSEL